MPPQAMERLIRDIGRKPRQRTTLYADASKERYTASFEADALGDVINTPARKYERSGEPRELHRPGLDAAD
ncbi:MAG: hypothetical protein OXR03_07155 [Rhodospirillaceae bacterium]|nr:hypothetical protein [Rhodospirillaceae bacterium]